MATIRLSDIPQNLMESDIIHIEREYDDDSYTCVLIYREREETDKEYQNRMEARKSRYEQYLKLKKEFFGE